MKLNIPSILKRLSFAAVASAGQVALAGHLPVNLREAATTAVVALAAALPVGSAPAGILRASAPGQISLGTALLRLVQMVLAAPANARRQMIISIARETAIVAGTAAGAAVAADIIHRTQQLSSDQLGKAAAPPSNSTETLNVAGNGPEVIVPPTDAPQAAPGPITIAPAGVLMASTGIQEKETASV